jgi:hypothetical protein
MADATEDRMEYVTIIGESFEAVAEECRSQKLHANQYAILHPIRRHQLTLAGGGPGLSGRSFVTATFARRAPV